MSKGNELALKLARHTMDVHINILSEICTDICSAATVYNALCVRDCNQGLTDGEQLRKEKLGERLRSLAVLLGPEWGVRLGGDPRGCTVKLTNPTKTQLYDDWGREGLCVPGA